MNVNDKRKFPQIPLNKILLATITRPIFDCKSMNQLDHFLKEDYAKKLFSSTNRDMVASATTIRRVYKQVELQQYKNSLINYSLYANSMGSWTGIKKHKYYP